MIIVAPIPSSEVRPWLLARHYAERMCPVSFAFGAYRGSALIGIVTYGKPVSPHLCRGVLGPEYAESVLELNRLCCENTANIASQIVGRSLRLLPKPAVVVSYADTAQGHIGYIYQATNFIYTGTTDQGRKTPRPDRIVNDGRHGRHEARIGDTEKVDTSIGILVYRKPKHRYVFFCGTRKQKAEMRSALKYQVEPYPKGETRRYDVSEPIQTQTALFV